MNVVRFALAGSIIALTIAGCTQREDRKVLGPAPPGETARSEVEEAHWIAQGPELSRAVLSASRDPLVQRALIEATQPNLRFLSDAAIAGVGIATDGVRYRITILPYADPNDPNRATFLTLLERDGALMCQRSELLASTTRVSPDSGYAPITIFGRTLYLRESAPYAPAPDGSVQRAPERFNKTKFLECFMETLPYLNRLADGICESLPQYPQCGVIANTIATAIAAVGCAVYAFK